MTSCRPTAVCNVLSADVKFGENKILTVRQMAELGDNALGCLSSNPDGTN